ncbi:succinylglutamate desuccinylase/aspartoacylase family protein [Primorskyibacter sedentarius]|uniref:succinylglutamate desuccinylase/aspartoacylase family protein n=1 Tax=Primorskyibacter sedentarius TaxID=745311 RepID=UPI003EBCEF0B
MAAPTLSRIGCPIDFDKNGYQAGYARAPHSRNNAGWGVIEIPMISIKNGTGPTVLLTGGLHGDEYEGQIAISRLAQSLDPGEIQGQVIMMPCVNVPAALADKRLSPIDGLDINRCFPGDPRGSFTPMLAHFLDSVVLPHVDISVDMHTAGHSLDAALSTNMHHVQDATKLRRTMAAAEAFGAPYNVVFAGVDEGATFTSSVEARRLISLGTELGGWGRVSIDGVKVGSRGIRNILKHFNILEGEPIAKHEDGTPFTRHMMVRDTEAYLTAPKSGIFEPTNYHGATVFKGQIAGYLHFPEDIGTAPTILQYPSSGVIWMGAGPGRVTRGDPVAVLMEDYRDDWL